MGGVQIPSGMEKLVQSLHEFFAGTLKDTAALQTNSRELEPWMMAAWTNLGWQGSSRPGSTGIISCQESSNLYWSMRFHSLLSKTLKGGSAPFFIGDWAYCEAWEELWWDGCVVTHEREVLQYSSEVKVCGWQRSKDWEEAEDAGVPVQVRPDGGIGGSWTGGDWQVEAGSKERC